jgi:5-amino-6-(5-phosphoribosylamino)uracil reductase
MRLVLPDRRDDVDPAELTAAEGRPPHADRPWLLVNMIATVDGATAVDGRSGALGGPGDKQMFSALRGIADVVLVAAGTVRAEHYGPPRASDDQQARRVARGQAPLPRLAICTASADLDPEGEVFSSTPPPLVYTVDTADADRRAALDARAELVVHPGTRLDVAAVVADLGQRGARVVLTEGGPSFNGALVAADLVDELCLTVAPLLASGESARIVHGPPPAEPFGFALDRVVEDGGTLFLRYVRPR